MQIHRNNDHNKTHRSNTYHLEPWPVSSQNPSQKVKKQKSNNPCHVKNWVKSPCPPHSSFYVFQAQRSSIPILLRSRSEHHPDFQGQVIFFFTASVLGCPLAVLLPHFSMYFSKSKQCMKIWNLHWPSVSKVSPRGLY